MQEELPQAPTCGSSQNAGHSALPAGRIMGSGSFGADRGAGARQRAQQGWAAPGSASPLQGANPNTRIHPPCGTLMRASILTVGYCPLGATLNLSSVLMRPLVVE